MIQPYFEPKLTGDETGLSPLAEQEVPFQTCWTGKSRVGSEREFKEKSSLIQGCGNISAVSGDRLSMGRVVLTGDLSLINHIDIEFSKRYLKTP